MSLHFRFCCAPGRVCLVVAMLSLDNKRPPPRRPSNLKTHTDIRFATVTTCDIDRRELETTVGNENRFSSNVFFIILLCLAKTLPTTTTKAQCCRNRSMKAPKHANIIIFSRSLFFPSEGCLPYINSVNATSSSSSKSLHLFCRNRRSPSRACLIAIFIRAKSSDRFGPRRDRGEAERSVRKSRRFLGLVQKQRVGMIRKAEAEAEADHSKWSKRREAQSLARNAEQQPVETKAKSKKNNNQRKKKKKEKSRRFIPEGYSKGSFSYNAISSRLGTHRVHVVVICFVVAAVFRQHQVSFRLLRVGTTTDSRSMAGETTFNPPSGLGIRTAVAEMGVLI
jgi:hypothetical protein